METAFLPIFSKRPGPNAEQEVEGSRAGQMLYAAHGVTTAHEGATHAPELELMQRVAAAGANVIDVVAYPFVTDFDAVLEKNLEALKAITINAAYPYAEAGSKGSLEPGKLADLVVLDKNPLKVDPMAIKDIRVVETTKEGKTIYRAN